MAYTRIQHKCFGEPALDEYKAAAAITPGHLVYKTSTAGVVAKHATAGGSCITAFACENTLAGKTVSDDYATSDRVQVWFPRRGDIVIALIAANENIAVGDLLESNGDGTLREVVADTSAGTIKLDSVVGFAEEATNVASVAAIKVRII